MTRLRSEITRCAILSRHQDEHVPPAATELLVCKGHEKKLTDMVIGVTELVEDLLLAHALNSSPMKDKVSGTTDPGLRFESNVADAGQHVHRTLTYWAHAVAEQRQLIQPKDVTTELVRFLLHHLDWIMAQPAVSDFHDQLEHDLREAHRLAYPSHRRRFVIRLPNGQLGRCIEVTSSLVATRSEQRCPGVLYADIAPADDLLPSLMVCDTCGIEISSAGWVTWGRRARKLGAAA